MGNAAVSWKPSAEVLGWSHNLLRGLGVTLASPTFSGRWASAGSPAVRRGAVLRHGEPPGRAQALWVSGNWTGCGDKNLPNPELLWRFEELFWFTHEDWKLSQHLERETIQPINEAGGSAGLRSASNAGDSGRGLGTRRGVCRHRPLACRHHVLAWQTPLEEDH